MGGGARRERYAARFMNRQPISFEARRRWASGTPRARREAISMSSPRSALPATEVCGDLGDQDPNLAGWVRKRRQERRAAGVDLEAVTTTLRGWVEARVESPRAEALLVQFAGGWALGNAARGHANLAANWCARWWWEEAGMLSFAGGACACSWQWNR